MSTTASREITQQQGSAPLFRNFSIHVLFALAQLAHNLLHLRRNPRSWQLFRVALGLAGAALVILPLSLWNSWTAGIAGLAMFTTAILLPRANTETLVNRKAREFGAPLVLDGGKYRSGDAPPQCGFLRARKISGFSIRTFSRCSSSLLRKFLPCVPKNPPAAGICSSTGWTTPPNFLIGASSPNSSPAGQRPRSARPCLRPRLRFQSAAPLARNCLFRNPFSKENPRSTGTMSK